MAFAISAAVVVGGAAAYSSYRANKDNTKAASANMDANYQYDVEKYNIQKRYHSELLAFKSKQEAYAQKQLNFAYQQLEYATEQYHIGLENNAKENLFRQKEVYNKKLSATTEYNSQQDSATIMKQGAIDSLNQAVDETMRTTGANLRDVNRQASQALGERIVAGGSGITGGKSRERDKIAVFMERNRAISQIKDQAKATMIQTSNQSNEMVNNLNLKIGEAYRNLDAIMRLEAAPVAKIAGPQPIFTEKQPVGPVTPLNPEPIKGVVADSGWSSLSAGISGFSSGYNLGTNVASAF